MDQNTWRYVDGCSTLIESHTIHTLSTTVHPQKSHRSLSAISEILQGVLPPQILSSVIPRASRRGLRGISDSVYSVLKRDRVRRHRREFSDIRKRSTYFSPIAFRLLAHRIGGIRLLCEGQPADSDESRKECVTVIYASACSALCF